MELRHDDDRCGNYGEGPDACTGFVRTIDVETDDGEVLYDEDNCYRRCHDRELIVSHLVPEIERGI